jgi:predicted GH43/DUF377 family glycosyl hydrolase
MERCFTFAATTAGASFCPPLPIPDRKVSPEAVVDNVQSNTFQLKRLGQIMEPEPGNPMEVEGVLNSAVIRVSNSELYLFPRLVAKGNYSRIGIAKVLFNDAGIDFAHVNNKDASFFPISIPNHAGKMQLGILHRPLFQSTTPEETACEAECREVDIEHESIWISYCPMGFDGSEPHRFGLFNSHHRLASPVSPWERLKIGGGTPPIITRHGWLIVYHGVNEVSEPGSKELHLQYSAGVMVLSKMHPREILYRSVKPVLTPELLNERSGIVPNVVFPTGIDRRDDLGLPDRFDVYYGMADNRIGVARLDLPDVFSPEGIADSPDEKM